MVSQYERIIQLLHHINAKYDSNTHVNSSLSWSAYHTGRDQSSDLLPFVNAILPASTESVNSPAMVAHCLCVIATAIYRVNPEQITVVCKDQALFAIAKQIQWHVGNELAEDRFIILFGAFHIEQVFENVGTMGRRKWLVRSR